MDSDDTGGVDHAWVMQTTFVVTVVVGVPVVVASSLLASLSTFGEIVPFTVRVGALVWFCTAVGTYVYARRNRVGGTAATEEAQARRLGGESEDERESGG